MGPMQTQAAKVGHTAWQAFCEHSQRRVMGVTSRGVFIRAESGSRWVIFVSYEPHCSPLTITLNHAPPALSRLQAGDRVLFRPGELLFPAARTAILAAEEQVWQSAARPGPVLPPSERLARLNYFVAGAIVARPETVFNPLLAPEGRAGLGGAPALAWQMGQALSRGQLAQAESVAQKLLGRGRGLTPSGDDFIIGLLLLLNRWPNLHHLGSSLPRLNQQIVQHAYRKTTTISANLVECAAAGQSDERLVNVAECIVTGTGRPAHHLAPLLGWGASSGVDALAGLAVGLAVGQGGSAQYSSIELITRGKYYERKNDGYSSAGSQRTALFNCAGQNSRVG